jgi:hypothetical protein
MAPEEPLPSPKGPLEGSGEPPEVRPPGDAIRIDEAAEPAAEDAGEHQATSGEGEVDASLSSRARTWVADKIAPDSVELVAKSGSDDEASGSKSGGKHHDGG